MAPKFYAIIALILALMGFIVYERYELTMEGENKVKVAVAAANAKAVAARDAEIAKLAAEHIAEVATIKVQYEATVQSLSVQHDSDAQRVRDYDALRAAARVRNASPGPGLAPSGSGVADELEQRFSSLEVVALQLAQAGAASDAAVGACMAERDSLTGK